MPAAFDDTFDYLTLLGLDSGTVAFQPIDEVHEAIKRKKKEWTAQAINPLYQQQARASLERARQFEKILDTPDALQAYLNYQAALRAERRAVHEQAIGELLAQAIGAGRKSITTGQWELLRQACDERQIPPAVVDDLLAARGLKVVEDEPATGTSLPYKQPALDRALMTQIDGHLRVLAKQSFYELVDLPASSPVSKVVATAQILYDRWSKSLPKTSECVAWEKSLQSCLTYLKDDEAKTRYDAALFNRRLDQFLWRVDLVLASGHFTRDDFVHAATIGVREFGLTNEIVNQCVRLRAAARGLSMTKPVQMVVQTEGLAKCQRCFRYSPADRRRCTHCGCEFDSQCHNPACGKPLAPDERTCRHCGLKSSRGVQYRELLRLAEALTNSGDGSGASQACRLAGRILNSPQVTELAARAARIGTLVASIRAAAGQRRWSAVERELPELLELAPEFSRPGFPKLEQISTYTGQLRERLAQLKGESDLENQARACVEILEHWTDSDEATARAGVLAEALEQTGRDGLALDLYRRLAEVDPKTERWRTATAALTLRLDQYREKSAATLRAVEAFRQAFSSDRLYAADRLTAEFDEASPTESIVDSFPVLRARLARVRAELAAIRDAEARGEPAEKLIDRHLAILAYCRDCRESLAALQTLRPAAPQAPRDLQIAVQGTRRVLTWQESADEVVPTAYTIERSIQKPGAARPAETAWKSLAETVQTLFLDDEVLHAGTIVRYAIRAARRGTLSLAGSVLQEFSVASEPVFAPPLLLSQEVLGLRAKVSEERVELHWHAPAGARQVLVERWPGTREDRPERAELLPTPTGPRFIDTWGPETTPRSYRVYCIYDGPEGDVLTAGTIVTVAPGEQPQTQPAAETSPSATGADAIVTAVLAQAPAAIGTAAERESNPLKRLGLWPPVPERR